MLSKLAIDPLALQVFGCIAKQFLQIFLLSVDCPFIDVCCILNIFRETIESLYPKYIQRDYALSEKWYFT